MSVSRQYLGRNLRLVLLLLMLASQAIAITHESSADHDNCFDACSSCLLSHGMGAAIASSPVELHLQSGSTAIVEHTTTFQLSCTTTNYHSRAPPETL